MVEAKAKLQAGVSSWDLELLKTNRDLFIICLMKSKADNAYLFYHVALADYRLITFYLSSKRNEEAEKSLVEAKKYLQKSMALDPSFGEASALYDYLLGFEIALHPDKAMTLGPAISDYFSRAFEKEPENPRIHLLEGISLFYTPPEYGGGADKAVPPLTKAADLFEREVIRDPLKPSWGKEEAMTYLAMAYKQKKDYEKARELLKKALEANPEFGLAKKELSSLEKKSMTWRTKKVISLLLILGLVGAVHSQESVTIEGKVFDRETNEPLPACVMLEEAGTGITTDANGHFKLQARLAKNVQTVRLSVWLIGYKKKNIEAKIGEFLSIALDLEPLAAHEIVVSADSVVSDERNQKTVTLSKMDVYSIPGTAADPIHASQVLPGVNALHDTSSLVICSGAPDEVGYFFDGIEIRHPFLSETMHESYFSIFDNQVVDSFNISTSGFHPKYGDALSGIMDISAKDTIRNKEGGPGLSVLGLHSYVALPLTSGIGFVGSYNLGFSELLTRLNSRGGERRFRTRHAFGKFIIRPNDTNWIKVYGLSDNYRYTEAPSFAADSLNRLAAISWTLTPNRNFVSKLLLSSTLYHLALNIEDFFKSTSETMPFKPDGTAS